MSGLTCLPQEIRKPSLGGGWFLVAVRCVGSSGWNLCQRRLTADQRHSLTDTEVAHLHSSPFEIFQATKVESSSVQFDANVVMRQGLRKMGYHHNRTICSDGSSLHCRSVWFHKKGGQLESVH